MLKKEKVQPQTITVEHSEEEYKALADASSHVARFHITGGATSCDDATFKGFGIEETHMNQRDLEKGQ